MFLAFVLLVGNLLCVLLEGGALGPEDLSLMNYLTGYTGVEAAGAWGVPKMILGFFTTGFPRLIMWDFSFFQGGYELIRWLLMSITIGAIAGMTFLFIPTISQIFSRR